MIVKHQSFEKKWLKSSQLMSCKLTLRMHLAFSTMDLTRLSANIMSLLEAISMISFSPILATMFGSNPAKASLH